MFQTRVTKILGIKYPIIAGPMAYISEPYLVSAVSNAGGLGIIASLSYDTVDELRAAIKKTKELTDKPFAVNVTFLPTFRAIHHEEYLETAIDEGVRIIETSGRSPEPYMDKLKSAGIITMHRATRTRDIKTAERCGVDIVTILGSEAAGHPGQEEVSSMVRIPVAVDAVEIPVIAAGGIMDARGFIAALSLGAEGILMGTRFMICQEARIHENIKKWLCGLTEADTVLIQKSIKNATRVVKNPHTESIIEMEKKGATLEELMPMISGQRGRQVYATGEYNDASISVGQCVGLIKDIPAVKEIIDNIISEGTMIAGRIHEISMENHD